MFRLALVFLALAVLAGVEGFVGPVVVPEPIAKVGFFVFLVLFAGLSIAALFARNRRDLPPPP